MRIQSWTQPSSLSALGAEAARLLCSGDLATLAARFGYALAQGLNPETAGSDADTHVTLEEISAAA